MNVPISKVNVDEQPELASQFGVMSIPALVVLKNGKIVNQAMGARPKSAILGMPQGGGAIWVSLTSSNSRTSIKNLKKAMTSCSSLPELSLPGVGIDKLFTLRTVEDTFRIKDYITQHHPKSAVLASLVWNWQKICGNLAWM